MNIFGKLYSEDVIDKRQSSRLLRQQGITIFKKLAEKLEIRFNPAFFDFLLDFSEVESFYKNEIILGEEDKSKTLYLILNGIVEFSSEMDGEQMLVVMLNSGNIIANYNAILMENNNFYRISITKDSILLKLNSLTISAIQKSEHKESFNHMVEKLKWMQERFIADFSLISRMQASKKINKIYNEYKYLMEHIPQGKLAQLLGIKPETLSRLKKIDN